MERLEKKGYLISVEYWVGNLGNHLIQLTSAINVAKQTQSKLTLPPHALLRRRTYNFMERSNKNCLEPIVGRFFYRTECYQFPVAYDQQRRVLLRDHLYDDFQKKSLGETVRRIVHRGDSEAVNPDTLVINMRSGGDIFRTDPPPQNDYMQPPLSFYKHIIESHGYRDCLIVTERDRKNPCIDGLLSWSTDVRIKTHESVKDDLRTLLSARHLVMCHSTFSALAALMSMNLCTLHQPHSFQLRGLSDVALYTYKLDNYIRPGEWTASPAQLALMVNHSVDDIEVFSKPPLRPGETAQLEPSYLA